jgi:ferric-dicitrate binding protein FerR (iron transport regulator)
VTGFDARLGERLHRAYPEVPSEPNWSAVVGAAGREQAERVGRPIRARRSARGRRLVALAVILAALVSGTAVSYALVVRPNQPPAWVMIVNDWLRDGRIDGRYSCADLRKTAQHIQKLRYPSLRNELSRARAEACE